MAMDEERLKDLLKNAEYGIISTVGEEGHPYGFPMSYVYMDDAIYFHCGMNGHKIKNMDFNNKVSMTIMGKTNLVPELLDTNYESIILFGSVGLVPSEEKILALREIVKKYAPDFVKEGDLSIDDDHHITSVYKIRIDHITGKTREDGKR